MDFIKRHYEKIVLAGALLILIVSAVLLALKVGALSTEIQEGPRRRQKGEPFKPTDLGPYSNAIVSLKEPAMWTNDPGKMFPSSVVATQLLQPEVSMPTNAVGPKIALAAITHRQFKLRFDAYSGEGENFQLNFQFRPRTFFVPAVGMPVGDQFETTGYTLAKFEKKTCREDVPGVGERDADCSTVLLQRGNEKPIPLVLGKPTQEDEPIAAIVCGADPRPREVRRGLEFVCEGVPYKVVDIDSNQVIILDRQSGETHTISLPAPKE
jgi:hypothetical protein